MSNVEHGMSNVEGRNSIASDVFKGQSAAIPSFDILRFDIQYSAVRFSTQPPPSKWQIRSNLRPRPAESHTRLREILDSIDS
jgi:hypothetical protein